MRIYVDMNTINVFDAFTLGHESILERTLEHHRLLVPNHPNTKVVDNAAYYRSQVYTEHLGGIIIKAFGRFHDLITTQLVCINTLIPMDKEEGPIEKLMNVCAMDVVRDIVGFDKRDEIEYLLFDEDTQELLYKELEEFRDELIRVVRSEIGDALKAAVRYVK